MFSSYMQILFMEKETSNSIMRDSVLGISFWQLMTFDISANNLRFLKRQALSVASSSVELNFFVHTRSRTYAVWNQNEMGFYLPLVIDCEKLIPEEGYLRCCVRPRNNFRLSNRTNGIIANKKIVFPIFTSMYNMWENDDLRNTINYVLCFPPTKKSVTSQ